MSKPLGRHAASLPVKDGALDKTVYDKFAAGSLRRRVWDAIVAAECPCCNGDHLRVACTKPRQGGTISNAKTSSLSRSLKRTDQHSKRNSAALSYLRILTLLTPVCYGGPAPRDGFLDTGSDISLARRDLLLGLHLFLSPVAVEHTWGEKRFSRRLAPLTWME
jgi:hypothetical protein